MTAFVSSLLIALFAWFQQPARDAPARPRPGTATISGMVVTEDTPPQPVRRARVLLAGDLTADSETATSDDSGHFVFRGIPTGRYLLQAVHPPYLPAFYGASRPGRAGTSVVVAADGQAIQNLTIRMPHGAAIEGLVTDATGRRWKERPYRRCGSGTRRGLASAR